jgi:chromosome segregation and condensation protein ScpB
MRNKIERNIEKSSMLTADELLSDSANRNQPIIDVKGTYGVGELFVQHYGIDSIRDFAIDPHADRQIKEV